MKTNLEIFKYQSREIRVTTDEQGEPWWVAKDVCEILDLSNVAMAVQGLDADEKLISTLLISGQNRETWTVNEPGLMRLIMRSNKEEAKLFQRWVFHDVLPQIRRTGQYSVKVPRNFVEALRLAADQQEQIEEKEKKQKYIGRLYIVERSPV